MPSPGQGFQTQGIPCSTTALRNVCLLPFGTVICSSSSRDSAKCLSSYPGRQRDTWGKVGVGKECVGQGRERI